MPRTLQDTKLDTRTARWRLKQRREPYWRSISEGLAIGYRKGVKGGTWRARHYSLEHGYRYAPIGAADDIADADGVHVLSFSQAQEAARKWFADLARQHSGAGLAPFTVAEVMDYYITFLENEGRSADAVADTRYRDKAFVRPALGHIEARSLTADILRKWRDSLAKAAPRLRTRPGEKQKYRNAGSDQRARRASANRNWTVLRAALNHAFQNDKLESDKAWRKVKPYKGVETARIRYLTIAECTRLINACEPCF